MRTMMALVVWVVACLVDGGSCACADQPVSNPAGTWCRFAVPGDPGSENCYADQATCASFGAGCTFEPTWCFKDAQNMTECFQGSTALDTCHAHAPCACFENPAVF